MCTLCNCQDGKSGKKDFLHELKENYVCAARPGSMRWLCDNPGTVDQKNLRELLAPGDIGCILSMSL